MENKPISFHKMCALGNDFIVIDERRITHNWLRRQVRRICDRRFGVGADQLLLIRPSGKASASMHIYNQDGSQARQCGNGMRAVAYLLFQQQPEAEMVTIEVDQNIHVCTQGQQGEIGVNLGTPVLNPLEIKIENDEWFDHVVEVKTGNPHLILWKKENAPPFEFDALGLMLQSKYPEGINVHCVRPISDNSLYIEHWERGAGITPSCGSGTVAAAFSANHLGFGQEYIQVQNAMATLQVQTTESGLILTGPVQHVFDGEMEDL